MFGAVLKTYFREKQGIDPSEIMSVSIMPCTAKKNEIGRRIRCLGYRMWTYP